MGVVLVLIPISLVLVGVAVWAFFWATGSGQFDDLDAQAWEILTDDEAPPADAAGAPERIT
jgi:cbb3-type cytochrome oxidase maturation protein